MPSAASSTPVRSPRTLHTYKLGRLLGRGGFGRVYSATLVETGQRVAVKCFRTDNHSASSAVANWSREYAQHVVLHHPNILQIFDAFVVGDSCYIVTELAVGTLEDIVGNGTAWPVNDVVRAGVHLSSALNYLHEHCEAGLPIIHRDVTTRNIFFFESPNVFKLGDFGISKILGENETFATTQVANWGFVAPELTSLGYTTTQSDLYQLGLVLFAMVAGEHAIDQSLPGHEKIDAIQQGVPWMRARDLSIGSAQLKSIIKKLLLRDTNKRYGTAAEVYDELKRAHAALRLASLAMKLKNRQR